MTLPTYTLIKVKDIKNNIYILENGGLRAVLKVTGINFSLFSEEEQAIILSQFKNFLDGLDFPVEILILSRFENINDYLKILHLRFEEEKNQLIKFQLEEYLSFLEDYTNNHHIMKKIFFTIIPYDPLITNLKPLQKISFQTPNEENLEKDIENLETRVLYVYESLSSMGLEVERLRDNDLIELLFEVYNPSLKWGQIPRPIIEKLSELK